MILTSDELQSLYESIIKPFGHPDPVGYLVRALLESEGDPEYWGVDGRVGFMPVDPERAYEMVGARNVTTLQNNVLTTMTMDQMFFDEYGSIDDMITAFHFDEEKVVEESATVDAFISEVDKGRAPLLEIVEPRQATVSDVIKILNQGLEPATPSQQTQSFIDAVLNDG